jgi:DNA-binding protein H-NS
LKFPLALLELNSLLGVLKADGSETRKETSMDINLDGMTLKELKSLHSRVGRAVATYEDRRKKEAIAALDEQARAMGFASLSEVLGGGGPRKRAPATMKYANPADKTQTWSGRGRKPHWFAAALKNGTKPDDMMV